MNQETDSTIVLLWRKVFGYTDYIIGGTQGECMVKQSEASSFGGGENMHLAEESLTHPAHVRPRLRQILDRECHTFSTDASSQQHLELLSQSTYNAMMRYQRPPQVLVREWNLRALREYLCEQTFSEFQFQASQVVKQRDFPVWTH